MKYKKANEMSIGDALGAFLDQTHLTEKLLARKLTTEWATYAGEILAKHTEEVWFKDGVLFVRLDAPDWKHELLYSRTELKNALNKALDHDLIQEVRVL
jgi:predicted nucleic acid-binding Zn ribbon protein